MNWISIKDDTPHETVPVLFQEAFCDDYHVGYWNEEENGMTEFPNPDKDGWKWSVKKWTYIV
jgi:hypothetical protein